jgi:transposase
MAYREHGMWEVLEVLRRVHRGEGRRAVSRATGRSRNAIRRYLRIAGKLGWGPGGADDPDEDLAAAVTVRLKPGPKDASPGETEKKLLEHKEQIRIWLEPDDGYKRGLRLTKIQRLLVRQGVEVAYGSLYRFAVRHLEFGKHKTTVRVADCGPGELAEVDFGRLGLIPDPSTGKRKLVHALVVTLVFSRHQYVHLTHRQQVPDLIEGLENAWEYFGGVPARVVLDNLKAAVIKPDRYDPTFQRTFEEYAHHRGFVIDAAVPRHPKGKPHVERQVPYVRDDLFRGESFTGIEHAQQVAQHWCTEVAGRRIHGTTRLRPIEQFETLEKPRLKPLDKERFDTPDWAELLIHPDFHVRYQYALYSVPHKHRGATKAERTVTVRADSKLVRIYKRGQLIKTHPRRPAGTRSTDRDDYPADKAAYAMRDVEGLISWAKRRGNNLGEFTQRLLSGTFPWAKLRQTQKLLRLADRYGDDRVDAACRRALDYDLINVRRVQNIIEKSLEQERPETEPPPENSAQQALNFLRDAQSFTHPQQSEEKQ